MIEAVQISFADLPKTEALEALVVKEAEKLERFFDRIVSCRVRVHQAYKREGSPYVVHIEIGVPGDTIVVDGEANFEVQRAIRDAFHTAGRRVEEYARRLRTPRV